MIPDVHEAAVAAIIRKFYEKAAVDPIIGHFFFEKDLEHIIAQQTRFAVGLLGGQGNYRGQPMEQVHEKLGIRPPHFDRRQMLLKEVILDYGLPETACQEWLRREHKLRSLIVHSTASCLA